MDHRVARPEASLAWDSEAVLLSVLLQPGVKEASIEPHQGVGHCYWPEVVGVILSAALVAWRDEIN